MATGWRCIVMATGRQWLRSLCLQHNGHDHTDSHTRVQGVCVHACARLDLFLLLCRLCHSDLLHRPVMSTCHVDLSNIVAFIQVMSLARSHPSICTYLHVSIQICVHTFICKHMPHVSAHVYTQASPCQLGSLSESVQPKAFPSSSETSCVASGTLESGASCAVECAGRHVCDHVYRHALLSVEVDMCVTMCTDMHC